MTRLDLDDYIERRGRFTDEEWLDLLVQSIGFNPVHFDRRTKWLMMLRLVPFVESNYNLIELGPQQTGKTYTFRNTSSRAFVVSGGKATPATLFFHGATKRLGVVGTKHVVYFDEISKTKFDDASKHQCLQGLHADRSFHPPRPGVPGIGFDRSGRQHRS